jgi:hypothetical protein
VALGADAVFDKSTELEALLDYCIEQTRKLAIHRPDAPDQGSVPN